MKPSDGDVKLVFPYPQLTTEEVCPAPKPVALGPGTHPLPSPNSTVKFLGCWSGKPTVKLLTVSDNTELARVQVTINTPSISISGLASSLAKGSTDPFTVTASNLSSGQTHSIEVLAGDADIGFGSTPGNTKCSPLSASSGNLSGSTSYTRTFTLHACNGGGATVFASILHGTRTVGFTSKFIRVPTPAPTPPPAPAPPPPGFTAPSNFRYEPSSTTSGRATFYWTAATGADSHKIEKYVPDLNPLDNDWHQVGSTPLGSAVSQFTLSNISTDSVERYRVTASKSGKDDKHSNEVDVRLRLIPQNLSGQSDHHSKITLTWDAVPNATSYIVEQRKHKYPVEQWAPLPFDDFKLGNIVTSGTKVTATVSELAPGGSYKYKVRAVTVHGTSDASEPTGEIPVTDERPENPPSDLRSASTIGFRALRLDWNDDSRGATGYLVETEPPSPGVNKTNITPFPLNPSRKQVIIDGLPYGAVYTFKVYAVNGTIKSEDYTPIRLTVGTPTHWWGHQEDHTVAWMEIVSNNEIEDAIAPAVKAWNDNINSIHGLSICKASEDACDGVSGTNHDHHTVEVRQVDNDNKSDDEDIPSNKNMGCGRSVACIKPDGGGEDSDGPGDHMGDMVIVFEDPPWSYMEVEDPHTGKKEWKHVAWQWSRTEKHGKEIPNEPDRYFHTVDSIMIHEFGHSLGLHDFYDDDTMDHLFAIMNDTIAAQTVQDEDKKQLEALYLHHSSSAH